MLYKGLESYTYEGVAFAPRCCGRFDIARLFRLMISNTMFRCALDLAYQPHLIGHSCHTGAHTRQTRLQLLSSPVYFFAFWQCDQQDRRQSYCLLERLQTRGCSYQSAHSILKIAASCHGVDQAAGFGILAAQRFSCGLLHRRGHHVAYKQT